MGHQAVQISLGQIAKEVGGTLLGSSELMVAGVSFVNEANQNQITFAVEKQTLQRLEKNDFCKAGAVIVPRHYEGARINIIKVDNPLLAFAKVISLIHPEEFIEPGISPMANIHSSASLGERVFVAPFASIGARTVINDGVVIQSGVFIGDDVVIGKETKLLNNVTILSHTRIGNRVIIQTGSLIGGDGFDYLEDGDTLFKIPHAGNVVIEDDVHIGAYNTIEKANIDLTLIKEGVKTGNFVYIAHNVSVGEHTQIGGQAGVAGNTVIGDHVLIGPQAGIDQELIIGNHAVIGPRAVIIADMTDGQSVYGISSMTRREWLRSTILIPRLSAMEKEIKKIAQEVDKLKGQA